MNRNEFFLRIKVKSALASNYTIQRSFFNLIPQWFKVKRSHYFLPPTIKIEGKMLLLKKNLEELPRAPLF